MAPRVLGLVLPACALLAFGCGGYVDEARDVEVDDLRLDLAGDGFTAEGVHYDDCAAFCDSQSDLEALLSCTPPGRQASGEAVVSCDARWSEGGCDAPYQDW